MADNNSAKTVRPSPIDVHQRLRSGLAESVVSRSGIRHDGLNNFLRTALGADAPSSGALLSDLLFQAAPGYVSSGRSPFELTHLLHPRTIEAISNTPDRDLRFNYHAYAHQLRAWEILGSAQRESVLVSSGTGSGKTECFLVPMLDDLVREAEQEGPLTGVRALMLYPLNALIASQEKRLSAWTKPLGRDVRFALYNGLMKDARKSNRDRAESEIPQQVLYRQTLRTNPPPVLVTNQTMLEYMTIRREDRPILEASQGTLRWIIIDEAHSYIGSSAAELSLLLRRVMNAFGVKAEEVRFVATSATIGSAGDEEAITALQTFLADLAGIPLERAHVVVGKPQPVDYEKALAAASDSNARTLIEKLEQGPQTLGALRNLSASADKILLNVADRSSAESAPVLPMRAHSFVRAIPGLWTCINANCSGKSRPENWPFGAILFEDRVHCPHCNSTVFELLSCGDCGEPFLPVNDEGERIVPQRAGHDADEFREDSYRERDHEDADEEPPQSERPIGHPRLIAINPSKDAKPTDLDVKTGAVSGEPGPYLLTQLSEGRCPSCRSNKRKGRPALLPFRFGAPFLTQNATPILLEGVSPSPVNDRELPFEGRQLISFTDSRQGTARFAANIETNGERGFVRGFIYHAVQKAAQGSELEPAKRHELEEKRSALEKLVATMPAFKDDIAKIDVQLAGGTSSGIPWKEMVSALANEPALSMMAKVWDVERSERYHEDRLALARFLMLREMARRPRMANAMETLGLARLRFPEIERLGATDLPEMFASRSLMIEDWRDFLYYLVDYLRAYFAVDVDDADARWMPGQARPRNIIGPGSMPGETRDLAWPTATEKGRQPDAVLLLASALNLNLAEARDRHDINQLFAGAWEQLRPLLEGVGGTYRLRLEQKAEIEAVRQTWRCPLTRRLLPRLVFGRSSNMIGMTGSFASKAPTSVSLPSLPRTRPLTLEARAELIEWLAGDEEVEKLRSIGIWSDIHDRAALAAPYLRAEEHSAQQPPHRLREFEEEFKQGEINLLACSTTMEMGVDIGSIEAVLMTNVPPSIANYNQRAGRAGRRGQAFSSALTIARDTPLDRETFSDPAGYLRRKLASPRVSLDSDRIAQRHANAFLLAEWFRRADGEVARTKAGDFFGCRMDLREFEGTPPVDSFCDWLRMPETAADTTQALQRLLRRTGLEFDPGVHDHAAQMFTEQADSFRRTWLRMKADAEELKGPALKSIEIQARRLCREFLLKELANRSLIPGSGFPTAVVPFDTYCAETQKSRERADASDEGPRDRRYECPSRNADIAIREYAPGAEVVVDGLVWTSAGVTLNWLSPIDSGQREPQNLKWAWWCDECGGAGSAHRIPEHCDHCGEKQVHVEQFLEPAGFRVDWSAKPHADTDQAVYIEPKAPKVSAANGGWQPLLRPECGRVRASHNGHIYHHSRGPNDKGYEICLECGRAGEAGSDTLEEHRPLTPRNFKAIERCPGNDAPYAITDALALGYELHTDVAEVQLAGIESDGAAWALASALREALAQWLGIETRELGISVASRSGKLGRRVPSLYLFDQASGGAGYAPRLLDELYLLFARAHKILDCPKECEKGCSACVLAPDLYKQQDSLDRHTALEAVARFLAENAQLPDEDIAVPDAQVIADAANTILVRAKAGDSVSIFLAEPFDLAELAAVKMRSFFASAASRGMPVTLVFSPELFDALGEVERRSLRNTAVRFELKLAKGNASPGAHESTCFAELNSSAAALAFFSRDSDAAMPGDRWAIGETYPVVCGTPDSASIFKLIDEDELERQVPAGDQVVLLSGFGQCPISQFGTRFVGKLRQELEASDAWRPGQLVGMEYTDRYLNSPLSMILFTRTCEVLAKQLRSSGDPLPVDVTVKALKRPYENPHRLFDDWELEDDRAETAEELGDKFGLSLDLQVLANTKHGRKLVLRYADGQRVLIFLDQGFGYWRVAGRPPRHDFRASPAAQARSLVQSDAAVSGTGESYFAITKQ